MLGPNMSDCGPRSQIQVAPKHRAPNEEMVSSSFSVTNKVINTLV